MPTELSIYKEQLIKEMRGTPEEYLPNLLQIVRLFRESVSLKSVGDTFRQGWQEAQAGKTILVSELWKDIEAE